MQTAARRKGNGYLTASVGLASNGITYRYGAHVTCSLYLELTK